MITYDMEQYSPEWWAVRTGVPTASCASKILTSTGKLSTQSDKYLNELLADKAGYGDEPIEPTEWMTRGLELEPEARALFELETGLDVDQVGFVCNDERTAGCSPDGLITEPIGIVVGYEVKCPKASTHFGYLRSGGLPNYYKPQVHFSMAVCGIDKWNFMSYYPGLDPLIITVEWDDYTDMVSAAIKDFTERLAVESAKFGL